MKNFNFNFNFDFNFDFDLKFNPLNNTFFRSFQSAAANLFNVVLRRRNDIRIFPDNKKYYRRKKNFRCKFSRFLRQRRQRFNRKNSHKIAYKQLTRKNTPRSISFYNKCNLSFHGI